MTIVLGNELTIELLKRYLDQLWPENDEVYEKIKPYLTVRRYMKSTVLRPPGEVELSARFIYKGVAAMFYPSKHGRDYRLRIFGRGDVASDLDSFFSGESSKYGIKSITYVSTFELSKEDEAIILESVPEASKLASKINQNILIDTTRWFEVISLPVDEGMERLKREHGEKLKHLSAKDLAFIFKTSATTIWRILKNRE